MEIRAEYKPGMIAKVVIVNACGPEELIGKKGMKVSYVGDKLPSGHSNVAFQGRKELTLLPDEFLDPSYLCTEEDQNVYISIPLLQPKKEMTLPEELSQLEPLLEVLGYKWSTHYRVDEERIWAVVNKNTNRAGRVGMKVKEAQEHVITMAKCRIVKSEKSLQTLVSELRDYCTDQGVDFDAMSREAGQRCFGVERHSHPSLTQSDVEMITDDIIENCGGQANE